MSLLCLWFCLYCIGVNIVFKRFSDLCFLQMLNFAACVWLSIFEELVVSFPYWCLYLSKYFVSSCKVRRVLRGLVWHSVQHNQKNHWQMKSLTLSLCRCITKMMNVPYLLWNVAPTPSGWPIILGGGKDIKPQGFSRWCWNLVVSPWTLCKVRSTLKTRSDLCLIIDH